MNKPDTDGRYELELSTRPFEEESRELIADAVTAIARLVRRQRESTN